MTGVVNDDKIVWEHQTKNLAPVMVIENEILRLDTRSTHLDA